MKLVTRSSTVKSKPPVLKKQSDKSPETMKSLRSALGLLHQFTTKDRDLGVGELATRSGISKATVSKALAAFAEHGFLIQNPETRRYSVGVKSYVFGSRFLMHDNLCGVTFPKMRELVQSTGHSARLSILDNDQVLYLLGLEGPWFMDTGWRAGTWLPAGSTTAGRVMLAFMEPAHAKQLLTRQPLVAATEHTQTNIKVILQLIAEVKQQGYAAQRNETTPGLGTVAVPIFGNGLKVLGALGLAFPSHVVKKTEDSGLAAVLHRSARSISLRMGCSVYPFGNTQVLTPQRSRKNT